MFFLEVNSICKSFSGKKILNNISFKVSKGQVFALCGESGSGKTTLLKAIAGLESTDHGTIYFKGFPVKGPAEKLVPGQAGITMVFQDTQLSPNRTVEENIKWVLRSYSKEYQDKRTDELLLKWKLNELRKKFPRELSGGEKQKTALARAIAQQPELLLLDEPFSNMDFLLKNELKDQLLDIVNDEGITLIFVTHDAKDALSVAEEIAIVREGELLQIGTPHDIYRKPASEYIARLFGAENIISANELLPFINIPPGSSTICIRAEDFSISGAGIPFEGIISKCSYYGPYQLVTIRLNNSLEIKVNLAAEEKYVKGQFITVYLEEEKIIQW